MKRGLPFLFLATVSFSIGVMPAFADIISPAQVQAVLAAQPSANAQNGDVPYTYEQFQKEFNTYFQGAERTKILGALDAYVADKLKHDGYDPKKVSASIKNAYYQKYASEFVAYAVQNGIIQITLPTSSTIQTQSLSPSVNAAVSASGITVAAVRAHFWIAVQLLFAVGLPTTATFLNNSLQDFPPDLTYGVGSSVSNTIKSSAAYQATMNQFKTMLSSQTGTYYQYVSSLGFTSPLDLFLSIDNAYYLFTATKLNGVWAINAKFYDTYNFEYWNYGPSLGGTIATIANNYGLIGMQIGAIRPYNIYVYATDSK